VSKHCMCKTCGNHGNLDCPLATEEERTMSLEVRITELEGELDGLRDALETISEIDRACGSGFQMHSNARNVSVQTGGEDE